MCRNRSVEGGFNLNFVRADRDKQLAEAKKESKVLKLDQASWAKTQKTLEAQVGIQTLIWLDLSQIDSWIGLLIWLPTCPKAVPYLGRIGQVDTLMLFIRTDLTYDAP